MSLDAALLAAVVARVAGSTSRVTAMGTVASITGYVDAMVVFDGDTLAVPVKLAGDVPAMEGDRVVLLKVGPWWTIVDTYTRRWPSDNGTSVQQTSGSTTSSSMADMPTNCSFTFTKWWGATRVKVWLMSNAFSSAGATKPTFGVQLTSTAAAVQTDVATIQFDQANVQRTAADQVYVSGLAAGVYTVTVQWRRNLGAGTISVDAGCRTAVSCTEVSPT